MNGARPPAPRPAAPVAVVLAAVLALAGCGGRKKPEAELWRKDEVEVRTQGEVGVYTEPGKFEKDIGLHARATADGAVVVSIRNRGGTPVFIMPSSFAVLTGPTPGKDIVFVSAATADVSKLTAEEIPPGRTTVVSFRLNDHPDPRGMRLVMRLPEVDLRMFADIE